jgi:D-glycero-beta-D-manno-heptose 1-phosphate adenylyltransferase
MGQVIDINDLAAERDRLRERGLKIVLTNGHFDLVHIGHLRYLQQAKALGDVLIVGINDDLTTTRHKGPRRPIFPDLERAELIAGLSCVDFATIFHEPTADELIQIVAPDMYVKGGDYNLDPDEPGTLLPEAPTAQAIGTDVKILPLEAGYSTSAIEERIIERWKTYGSTTS